MKNKIALKLTIYFSIILLLFSLVIGGVFTLLFRNHTIELYKADLEKRATVISEALSGYMDDNTPGQGKGYGAYIRFLDEIAMADVWVVDQNLEMITFKNNVTQTYKYSDLPKDAEKVVANVFKGETTFSEGFSELLNVSTLTVGVPIYSGDKIQGAILLHSPVEGMTQATTQGFYILAVSILAALLLSVILSILFAISFSRPLRKMRKTAFQLADGDYDAKTDVAQKDEIGELASAIDILSTQLKEANLESDRLLQLRHDFIANISHELRTPVTVMRGSLEALNDGIVSEPTQVKQYHRQMLNECIFLQRLVDDLLDLSRLQNTEFVIEMRETSLCDLMDDLVRTTKHIAQSKDVEIAYLKNDVGDCSILGDYDRLRQMFMIILDNAVKFSPKGGTVTISMDKKTVYVKDKGDGFDEKDLPYIFDRFYKVKSEENKEGTGLGLSIAKQIADRHGIEISVRSSKDEGTEFIFELR